MPHFLQKSILEEMMARYPAQVRAAVPRHAPHRPDGLVPSCALAESVECVQFNQTSANRFRSKTDMQYTFSYMYWLMSKKKDVNYTELFGIADSNRDGLLSDNEVCGGACGRWPPGLRGSRACVGDPPLPDLAPR
jgi:hypothetical protein